MHIRSIPTPCDYLFFFFVFVFQLHIFIFLFFKSKNPLRRHAFSFVFRLFDNNFSARASRKGSRVLDRHAYTREKGISLSSNLWIIFCLFVCYFDKCASLEKLTVIFAASFSSLMSLVFQGIPRDKKKNKVRRLQKRAMIFFFLFFST